MKQISLFLIAALLFPVILLAQDRGHDDKGPMKKIEELEKLKIIDVLGMNEETTLKFFARRDKYQNDQHNLMKQGSNILDEMDSAVKKGGDKNSPELKKLIEQYLSIQNDISQQRVKFINSLNDILSYKQISELLVFEKKFRDELRRELWRARSMHRK